MNEDSILYICSSEVGQRDKAVLHDVDVTVKKGEFVYLIGKTGSGKSTLLRVLYGDLPLKTGHGEVAGFSLRNLQEKDIPFLRRKLGVVFQDFQLLSDRNVYNNLSFVLRATGWKDEKLIKERIQEVLKSVNMEGCEDKNTFELSGGEQQRIVIARALLNSPDLIIADEPTGNLDPNTSVEIMRLLRKINTEHGTAVVMATHDYTMILKFPARTLRIEDGALVEVQQRHHTDSNEE
ncbi:MAG: ATP-binding cassette domain-containing protein [Flavobacteriales bacterium]|nr:ATP-binding cassette domain-containing protein [Flavobacteriales bacterium]